MLPWPIMIITLIAAAGSGWTLACLGSIVRGWLPNLCTFRIITIGDHDNKSFHDNMVTALWRTMWSLRRVSRLLPRTCGTPPARVAPGEYVWGTGSRALSDYDGWAAGKLSGPICKAVIMLEHNALPSVKRPVMELSSPTPNASIVRLEIVDGRPLMAAHWRV